ncbi:NCS1 family nucleobase:cation symporter-1 [Microbacterium capsulatum]|uniref:NCS1 family nucleobase:cation symporter-1 n=1 Tax=Microbacterium capsulatum TaxID=3041921 RepID=A0ABU0XIW2_9MICO|nr:NCS1 family nucleobase:cation symporter-1 [Microbacterium sp. ASV81]MDQ4215081.1 NCS1 family nucleobase:cation symporter-1 [Microbacterium sp. ASV81]
MTSHPRPEAVADAPHTRYSTRLYNADIAPRGDDGHWRTWDLFAWWMSAWHSLGNYTAAVGLLVLGLMGWQLALGLCLGVYIIYVASNVMGTAGQKVGVPFPVFARASFGVFGSNIPALLRAIVAVAWYGIQTYLASVVVMVLVLKIWPAAEALTKPNFLGLSELGWFCFLGMWVVQLAVLYRGMETVRKLSDFAGPTIWVGMFALAIWTLGRAGWKLNWNYHIGAAPLEFWPAIGAILAAAFLLVSDLSGPILNFADFTRLSPSRKTVINGNRLGLLVNGIAFCLVSVTIALAALEVYGKAINDPTELLKDIDSVTILILSIVLIAIATAGANVVLNFVSPAYDFSNVAPHKISFRTGGVITAVLSIVITPWNLYSNPVVVNLFLGGIGALMGPLVGIIAADFYLIRKTMVDQHALYSDDPNGKYFYGRGTNMNSVIAFVIAGGVALCIALVPAFSAISPFAWPIGIVLGVAACLVVNRIRPNLQARTEDLQAQAAETAAATE